MKTEIVDGVSHQFPDDATDEEIAEALEAMHPAPVGGPAGGMGDVKQREYEMSQPQPYKDPNFSGGFGQANTKAAMMVPRFAGDVAQTLSTGIINAAAQGVQDNWGHPLDMAGGVVANEFKNLASPFHTFETPIQSTSESLQRAGVSNTPMDPRNLPYGQFAPGGNAPIMGLADQAGIVADTFTPMFGGALLAKTLSYIPKITKPIGESVGKGMEAVGESQMRRVIKPLMRHERKAQKPNEQVIFEHGFDQGEGGAEPAAIYERSKRKLDQLGAQLKAQVQAGKDGGARVNTDRIINEAVQEFKATRGEKPDFYTMVNDIDEAAKDFKMRARAANEKGLGDLDLVQGQSFKQYMGTEGAWEQIAKSKGIPTKAAEDTRSRLAEAVYHKLTDAIDEGAPEGIRELNRQISEIIPVHQNAGWRQVVESRGNAIKLDDVVGMTAAALNPKIWGLIALNRASKSGTVASTIYRLGEKLRSAKTPAEQVRYAGALRKLGLTDEEIRAGMEIVESSGGPDAFRAQDLMVKDAPKEAANVVPFRPSETKSTQTGTGALANHNRRLAATQYLQSTTGQEPPPGDVYRFLEQLGENPVPKVPVKPKIERPNQTPRRADRHLEWQDKLLRNGNSEYPTIQVKASEAPDEFTLSGETYKKMKGYSNLTKYKDSKGRQYEFLGKGDVLHMDDPANPYTPPKPEGPTMKDGTLYDENGEELFQDERKLNGPSGSILRRKEGDGALITLFKGKANASTWQHEHAHWVRGQFDDATNSKALKSIGAEKWDRDAEEKFARGWERYLYEGKAPSKEIAPAMETMKKRMRDIYKEGQGLDDLPEEMRVLYDAVLLRNKKVSPKAKSILAAIPKAGKVAVPRLILALKKELENEKESR